MYFSITTMTKPAVYKKLHIKAKKRQRDGKSNEECARFTEKSIRFLFSEMQTEWGDVAMEICMHPINVTGKISSSLRKCLPGLNLLGSLCLSRMHLNNQKKSFWNKYRYVLCRNIMQYPQEVRYTCCLYFLINSFCLVKMAD